MAGLGFRVETGVQKVRVKTSRGCKPGIFRTKSTEREPTYRQHYDNLELVSCETGSLILLPLSLASANLHYVIDYLPLLHTSPLRSHSVNKHKDRILSF